MYAAFFNVEVYFPVLFTVGDNRLQIVKCVY